MMQSGHMVAQKAQPMHLSGSTASTGWWPFALIRSWARASTPLGQNLTQRPQPLHWSSLNVSFAK